MNRQRGFGAIAAIVVLVILAVLSAAIVSIGAGQQIGSAQDVMSARAWQAARAGNEWGLYKAISRTTPADPWKTCQNTPPLLSQTIDLTADTGFHVTVTCESWRYNEGESPPIVTPPPIPTPPPPPTPHTERVYRITAVACPTATCPPADATVVAGQGYVERTRVAMASYCYPNESPPCDAP